MIPLSLQGRGVPAQQAGRGAVALLLQPLSLALRACPSPLEGEGG
jgi:hypothetical protein